jgi:TonB family protein
MRALFPYLIIASFHSSAQDTIVVYFNQDWARTNKYAADYTRKAVENNDGLYESTDYRKDGSIYKTGFYSDNELKTEVGVFSYYFESGELDEVANYVDGEREGKYNSYFKSGAESCFGQYSEGRKTAVWKYYFKDGSMSETGEYRDGEMEGSWTYYRNDGSICSREHYSKGDLDSAIYLDKDGIEEEYAAETEPSFPGGEAAMMQWVQNNIEYPVEAVENGEQGIVYVQFVINRDGTIGQIKTVRGVSDVLDEESERLIKSMPLWIPGKQHNRFVRCKFTFPIHYRLDYGRTKEGQKKKRK